MTEEVKITKEKTTTTASVDSKAIVMNDLPKAQSRVEDYLDYLCGRATVLADLPKPQSRVEHFLEYLCYNGGIGGGGGQPLDPRTIINAEMIDDVLKFTHLDNTVTEIPLDLDNFARLDRDNLFLGHNTFNEVILMGKTPFVGTIKSEATTTGHKTGVYCGMRTISTHHDNPPQGASRYVSAIKIKVINSSVVGEKINDVYVTEIKKTSDRTTDIVGRTIVSGGSFIVEDDAEYGKCIFVPIHKDYTEDTYFIIGKKGNSALSECRYNGNHFVNECVNNLKIDTLPTEGDLLGNNGTGNGWIVIHSLVTDDINVKDTFEEIKHLISLLQSTDTTTYFVNNKAEFDQLQQDTNFVSGDIVYVIDSTGVEDYTNTDVNNGGKTVSLIYDENVSGFRVLSKDREDVVLNANLVTVNPTINNFNNVQDVLEDLDNRLDARFNTTLVDVSYEKDSNVLTFTKGDNTQEEVELKHFIERWGDLEHIIEHKITNIFDKNDVIESQRHHANGVITYEPEWCRYVVPCEPNEVISVAKKEHDSQVITFLDERGNRISSENFSPKNSNGWNYYKITVPNNSNIKQLSVNIYKTTNPLDDDTVMIYRGDKEPTTEFYPFANGYSVIIDGSKVSLTFDSTGSSLKSTNTRDALIELDKKIGTGGGSITNIEIDTVNGLRDALDGKVNTSDVGNNPNQIPQLDGQGKLDATTMPDLAITSVQTVQTKQDAQNLVTSGQIQVGDVVVVVSDNNSVYMYNGANHQNLFDNNFLELSIGTGTIRELNGLRPLANGQLTINAGQINGFDGNTAGTVQSLLTNIRSELTNTTARSNSNDNRISVLERKVPTVRLGDIVTTFNNTGSDYTVGGVTYLYIGTKKTVQSSAYPGLSTALGIGTVNNFELPVMPDTTVTFDNGRRILRKHYMVAKIS